MIYNILVWNYFLFVLPVGYSVLIRSFSLESEPFKVYVCITECFAIFHVCEMYLKAIQKLLYVLSVDVVILVLFLRCLCHLCLCHLLQEEKRSTTISQMFAKATKAFVKDTDHEGRLIPVSSLNDTDKLKLRSLIVKTRHRCFWQEPKYQSPGFTLGDVLRPGEPGNTPLSPSKHQSIPLVTNNYGLLLF